MKKSQFKDVKFNSQKEFKKWLKQTASKLITFSDLGQDMQAMWIHESGEILHCDFNSRMYNGRFVNTESLEWFTPVEISDSENNKFVRMMGLVVDGIENLN